MIKQIKELLNQGHSLSLKLITPIEGSNPNITQGLQLHPNKIDEVDDNGVTIISKGLDDMKIYIQSIDLNHFELIVNDYPFELLIDKTVELVKRKRIKSAIIEHNNIQVTLNVGLFEEIIEINDSNLKEGVNILNKLLTRPLIGDIIVV